MLYYFDFFIYLYTIMYMVYLLCGVVSEINFTRVGFRWLMLSS